MIKYKLIASDIDATLIGWDFAISQYNLEMIHRAKAAGVDFMLATGRIYGTAKPYAKQLNLDTPVIAANGGVVIDWRTNERTFGTPIPPEMCERIFAMIRENGLYYHFYCQEAFYTERFLFEGNILCKINQERPVHERFPMFETDDPAGVARKEDVYKISIRCVGEEKLKLFNIFSKMEDIAVTSSLHDNLEITAKGVSKGSALKTYAEMKGILPEEIISFGDNYNDITMIRYAGMGIAVENAVEELKRTADYITSRSDEDGVGRAIAKFVFGEEMEA